MARLLLTRGMLPSDAGLSWMVVSAGTKLVLMAWLLRWQQDVGTHHWSMAHEQLGLRPPPGRWGGVGLFIMGPCVSTALLCRTLLCLLDPVIMHMHGLRQVS